MDKPINPQRNQPILSIQQILQRSEAAKKSRQSSPHSPKSESPITSSPKPEPECARCEDTGYIKTVRVPGEEPIIVTPNTSDTTIYAYNRQAEILYSPCECLKRRNHLMRMHSLMQIANVPPIFQGTSFDTWDALPAADRAGKELARILCQQLAFGALETGHRSLVLSGQVGRGKSGLASCVVAARLAAGQSALWIKYNQMINMLRETYHTASTESYLTVAKRFVEADFLMLDDMGDMDDHGPLTADLRRNVYDVLGDRYDQERPTLITTNLTLEQFTRAVGDRIADRVRHTYFWCELPGKNIRYE